LYPNPLKQKLSGRGLVLGTGLPYPSPIVAGAVIAAAPDFLWIETEHAPYGTESLGAIPVLARQQGVAPMIRVAWNDPALIKKAYDIGAVAVMVPQINSAEEARQAVRYAHYPPDGQRGIAPVWPRIAGVDPLEVIRTANQETVLVLQMESREAYENLDEIKAVPGIDVLLVGPMDLSASVGKTAELGSPEVQEIVRDVPGRLAGTGIVPGIALGDVAEAKEKAEWGYRFINVGNPLIYGVQVVQEGLEDLRRNEG